jgi:hypothetical protein
MTAGFKVSELSQVRLRELLFYDPRTGTFTWRVSAGRRVHIGDATGGISKSHGYRVIGIDDRLYLAHRLAWLYMTGELPKRGIDHRDNNPSNNCWANLRPASQSQNSQNKRVHSNNQSGFKGVSRDKHGRKWVAEIVYRGRRRWLGTFHKPEHAACAYHLAALWYHGEFARVNEAYRGAYGLNMLGCIDAIKEKLLTLSILVSALDKQLEKIASQSAFLGSLENTRCHQQ